MDPNPKIEKLIAENRRLKKSIRILLFYVVMSALIMLYNAFL
jgi:hypothetical protein